MALKAVLFDIDGVLVDSVHGTLLAFDHAIQSSSLPIIPREDLLASLSMRLEDIYEKFYPGMDSAAIAKIHRHYSKENIHMNREFAGAQELLQALRKEGYKLAAISNRTSVTLELLLEHAKILSYFDIVIPGDKVTNGKPHPEIVLKACEALGVQPESCVVVGDAPSDVAAGRAAGARTIGVTYGVHEEKRLADARPDAIVHTLPAILSVIMSL